MNAKVSVLITNYNHAESLRRAINSVLMQATVYTVQIIVVDDHSTDNSLDILREYYTADQVSVVAFAEHYGLMKAYQIGFQRCEGQYIMLCDSDDRWCSTDKIQRQVEFMDEFTRCSLCVTKVFTQTDGITGTHPYSASFINDHLTYDNLLMGNAFIHAQSFCLRKSALDKYVDFDKFIRLGFHVWDYPIVLTLIQHSKFFCLDFYSAVYVKHVESVTNTQSRAKRFKYIMGNFRIRWYFIWHYGCKPSTLSFVLYKFGRDILSVVFKRWK